MVLGAGEESVMRGRRRRMRRKRMCYVSDDHDEVEQGRTRTTWGGITMGDKSDLEQEVRRKIKVVG